MKTRLMGLLAWPLLAAGCQSGSDDLSAPAEPQAPAGEALILECALAGGTRAGSDVQTSAFVAGRAVSVWLKNVMDGETRRTAFTEYACTVAANGTTLEPSGGTELTYVGPGEYVSAYAVTPAAGFSGTTFTVAADQTGETNYLASDLVFSGQQTYAQTSGALRLQFRHLLTKIIVNIEKGEDITDEQFATAASRSVVLRNIRLATTFDYANGQTVVSPTDATGATGTVTFDVGGACVIPPQVISAGKSFISIHEAGDVFQGNYIPSGQKTFEGGKQYTYTVTVERNKTTVSATVEDWNVIEADVASTHAVPHVDLTSSDVEVGMVICSGGYACPPALSLLCGHAKVAVVAYVGDGDQSYAGTEAAHSFHHGLALALTDADGTQRWKSASNSAPCIQLLGTMSDASARSDKSGLSNTNILVNPPGGHASPSHTHPAAVAARGYATAHPDNTSDWFLPSWGQWDLMAHALTGKTSELGTTTNTDYKLSNFNEKILAAGGTGLVASNYQSSTEAANDKAWCMYFTANNAKASSISKTSAYKVRAVIAF